MTCATIASYDEFDDIVASGEHHLDFLRRLSALHFGIRALAAGAVNRVDPVPYARCFERLDQGGGTI